jgi:type I restriction enzyme, S subunit
MKDSGVNWLGQIPAHWEAAHLGYRYEVQSGRMLNAERATGENLRPYLRVLDVQWDFINTSDLPEMDFPPDARHRYRLRSGDLLVNEGGSYVGRSAIWRGEVEECYYQKALHRLRAHYEEEDTAEFLLFVFEAATKNEVFSSTGNQTTIDHLTAEQLRCYKFPFPPLSEQIEIASFIRSMNVKLKEIMEAVYSSVDLLDNYRFALISAAVNGQIEGLK